MAAVRNRPNVGQPIGGYQNGSCQEQENTTRFFAQEGKVLFQLFASCEDEDEEHKDKRPGNAM